MALDYQLTLPNDTIVMYVVFYYYLLAFVLTPYIRVWRSSKNAAAVTAKGLRIVYTPSDYFYLVTTNLLLNHLSI